jgi:hypothetical protein
MPEMFSATMATFFANFMPWVILTWSISYNVFISKINSSYSKAFSENVEAQKENIRQSEAYDRVDEFQADVSNVAA